MEPHGLLPTTKTALNFVFIILEYKVICMLTPWNCIVCFTKDTNNGS